ncbi:MAG TPA: ABC transporter C-terminal domain-containing protein, partial [Longimicrobiaceae bacterium]|nr:ABC transporter C-terminal domain-containing protein [Longimicrobiaceae bacterium]
RRHEGSYDLYNRLRTEREAAEAERARPAAPKQSTTPAPKKAGPRKLSYHEKREMEGMEESILAAEEEKERLGVLLADPALYTDTPERVGELTTAFQQATERVDALYARWAALEEITAG